MELNRTSLGRQIAKELRRDILYRRLKAGEPLSQTALCERFGTSRMPIRDALQLLQYEGLVEPTNGKHVAVAAIDSRALEDVYDIKALVHARATRHATETATDSEIAGLAAIQEEMRRAVAEHDTDSASEANWKFHHMINRIARAPHLIAALRALAIQPDHNFFNHPSGSGGWVQDSVAEHDLVLRAMAARDATAAEEQMQKHVRHSVEVLNERLSTGPESDDR